MADDADSEQAAHRRALSPLLGVDEYRPLSATVRVELGAASHAGKVRTVNEDHYLTARISRSQETLASSLASAELPGRFEEHGYAMVLADGLGGRGVGGVASRAALNTLVHLTIYYGRWNLRIDQRTAAQVSERLEWCYARVNEAVQRLGRESPEIAEMATTMTASYSAGEDLFISHVGHSRAYLFRAGELRQLTRDQTVESRLAQTSRPTPFAYMSDDSGRILTDAVGGATGTPHVQIGQYRLEHGDCVLLCTDGLFTVVSSDRMADVLAERRRPQDSCDALVALALEAGAPDNVTVLLGQYAIPKG